ncbi:MAG: hypothetical protein HETSPECPRED_003897 [Heterodermia speciosa]|uniref:Haloacid dehalogenase n=1 Tax=Heterodermia speciosa TaxID=116794 RepID=A0A8H3F436_9LECA|nr:MAG: hypothetical protein HETSPECPRED_003897 [Heterodermia speciosa]
MALSESAPSFTSFRALGFDVFSTLIDEPKALVTAIAPLVSQLSEDHEAKNSSAIAGAAFGRHENALQQKEPFMIFEDVLSAAYRALAREWHVKSDDKDANAVAAILSRSSAFPDTVEALHVLSKHYKLIALSNVSEKGIATVMSGALKEAPFDAVLTAEKIGSYKPDLRNFETLMGKVKDLGFEKEELLMVAQGVASDHVPSKRLGINSVWISRDRPESERGFDGIGAEHAGNVAFGWRYCTLGDMAKDVEKSFAAGSS